MESAKCHQVPDGCAKSPARPVFVKFDYTALTSELDRKRQVPHRQDHTDARMTRDRNVKFLVDTCTTTTPERQVHGYAKFHSERVRIRRAMRQVPLLTILTSTKTCTTTVAM